MGLNNLFEFIKNEMEEISIMNIFLCYVLLTIMAIVVSRHWVIETFGNTDNLYNYVGSVVSKGPEFFKTATGVFEDIYEKKNSYDKLSVNLADNINEFNTNKSDPSCCPSIYSNRSGCVCVTKEQSDNLNERGGNRTMADDL